VRRDGERVRVTAQLIDTRSGANLWADRFDRKAEDIFAVQDEITRRIIATLVTQVSRAELQRVRREPPNSFVAYDHYLQAVYLHRRIFAERERGVPIHEARLQLESAVAKDGAFALAYTQLAYNYYQSWAHPTGVAALKGEFANPKTLGRALAAAQKAVDTDPRVAEAHAALGYVLFWLRRHDDAFASYKRAFAINPNLQDDSYSAVLALGGRSEECIAYIGRMLRSDPTHGRHYGNLGLCYYHKRDYAKAAALLETCKQFARGWRACWTWRTAALSQLGRMAEAKAEAAENMRRDPKFTVARWMRHFGRNFARRGDAEHVVEGLRKAGLPD
jgi:adenylate cyclase